MELLTSVLNTIDAFVWGPPLLILLLGTGLFFTLQLRAIQIRQLPRALRLMFSDQASSDGDISSFAALCTALSATIGTGNIVGVATAVTVGGPGALFWLFLAAFFGMATKYAESLLAVKYRTVDDNGDMAGGPMYYIQNGLGSKKLAAAFAVFGIGVAFFGIGTFPQTNAISESLTLMFPIPPILVSVILTALVALVVLGGITSIAKTVERLVPFMAVGYFIAALIVVLYNIEAVPASISLILKSAFTGHAAFGGFTGAGVMAAIRLGIARGIFSNESGIGSAPIAAAAARTDSCVRQGLISMTGTFFDSIIVCSLTGLVLVMSGMWSGDLNGASLTSAAFDASFPVAGVGNWVVTVGLVFFAFTTILGWNYYGERCTVYLFGTSAILIYRIVFLALIFMGPFLKLDFIWILADIVNALMAIPNLIALIGLRAVVKKETDLYFAAEKRKAA